jgi:hypothetical protein
MNALCWHSEGDVRVDPSLAIHRVRRMEVMAP